MLRARWTKLSLRNAPCARSSHKLSAIAGKAYLFGGEAIARNSIDSTLHVLGSDDGDSWKWQALLPELAPPARVGHAQAVLGSKLYVQGGACYDRVSFSNWADCTGGTPGLGKRLYEFDVTDEPRGWQRLPDNPGPPRANAALSSVRGSLFVIGGNTFVSKAQGHRTTSSMTLVDNWRYDPITTQWSRLADLPVASGNFQTNGVK